MFRGVAITALLAIASAGCYSPSAATGAPCSPAGECPEGQTCVAGTCRVPGEADASIVDDAPTIDATDAAPDAPPDAALLRPEVHGVSTSPTGSTAATITSPQGTQIGDLLVVHASADSDAVAGIVAPAGWTREIERVGMGSYSAVVFYKFAAAETETFTFMYPSASNRTFMIAVGNARTQDPIPVSRALAYASSTTGRVPSIDVTVPRSMLFALVTADLSQDTYVPLPNMVELYNVGGGLVILGAYEQLIDLGPTGDRITQITDAAASLGIALAVAPPN